MKKLTDMTAEELTRWYREHPSMYADETFAILRDRIVAECAANLAEAERKGAREVAEWVLDYWQKNLTVHGSGYGADRNADGGQVGVFTRKLRSYLAAPAPEGVTLTCVVCGLSDKGVVPFATATGEPGHPDRDTCIGALGAALRAKVGAA